MSGRRREPDPGSWFTSLPAVKGSSTFHPHFLLCHLFSLPFAVFLTFVTEVFLLERTCRCAAHHYIRAESLSQPWKRVADRIFPPVFAEMYNPGQDMVDVPPPPVAMIVPPPIGPPAAPPFDELIQQSQWNLQQQEQHLHTLRQVKEKSAPTAKGFIRPDLQAAGRLCSFSL